MKKYLFLFLLSLAPMLGFAQNETSWKMNYLPALSLGKTAEFTRNLSPRGVEVEMNHFISQELSVGLAVGWNVFREKVIGESFEYNNALITGTQFRYTNIVPLNVTVKKYFGSGEMLPFVGIGLGAAYAKQTNNAGIFSFIDDKWQFQFAPEAGLQLYPSSSLMLSLKIKYSHSLKSGDFPGMSYLGLGIGIGLL